MMPMSYTYLGDGLYAGHDGYQLELMASNGVEKKSVYLNDDVWDALCKFMAQINGKVTEDSDVT